MFKVKLPVTRIVVALFNTATGELTEDTLTVIGEKFTDYSDKKLRDYSVRSLYRKHKTVGKETQIAVKEATVNMVEYGVNTEDLVELSEVAPETDATTATEEN